ncbi:Hpt domain-containing protein [uncultured Thiodictyon sp.]|uniref:hybrid sensor histidine kinase/response regulator n=1 Tax=uncultured Thiodictyon sp. TaxID=1846217 RepID=UPI0025EBC2EC|nr:Hpt domain-containing protein [uncultured Thiodictyon sp.]
MVDKVGGGLRWVKGEIAATLRRVTDLMDAYGQAGEPAALGDAAEALFEVRGVLLALELTAPASLLEEMQQLCDAMAERAVHSPQTATEAMMVALIQLPNHLDRLDAGAVLPPLSLLPTINDLRDARAAAPLSAAQWLGADAVLAEEAEAAAAAADLEPLNAAFRKVRPHFHRALVEWYRPATSPAGLAKLARLFSQLHRHLKDGPLADLFALAEAYAAALQGGEIAAETPAQALVGRLDRVFKPLAAAPPQWPGVDVHQLIDAFLDAMAKTAAKSPVVAELASRYGRVEAPPAPPEGASAALVGLALAMLGELVALKGRLELFVRGGRADRTPLAEIGAGLHNLARTLDVADAGRLPERLRLLADGFGALAMADAAEDVLGLEPLASELLGIESVMQSYAERRESSLGDVGDAGPYRAELQTATLREARAELGHVKEAILDCQSPGTRPETFRQVPDRLSSVAGALHMLGNAPAGQVAEAIAGLVRRCYLAADRWPQGGEFELLADAIVALELYIEQVKEGQSADEDLLRQVGDAVNALEGRLNDAVQVIPAPRAVPAPAPGAPRDDAGSAPSASAPTSAEADSSGGISPEFLEIFLEEAQEETATIGEQFGRWRSNPADEVALTTLRRSFHTLKGSGRMVGAARVGDLAQVAEGLFSQLLELSLVPDAGLVAYLSELVEQLPDLIAAEAQRRPLDIAALLARAAQFGRSSGGAAATVRLLAVPVSPRSESPGRPLGADPQRRPDEPQWFESHAGAAAAAEPSLPASGKPMPQDAGASTAPRLTDHGSMFAADDELLEIFREETLEHLDTVRSFLARAQAGHAVPDEDTIRALHTLSGSARMAGVDSIADVAKSLERQFRTLEATSSSLTAQLLALLERAVDSMAGRVAEFPSAGAAAADLVVLAADLTAFTGAAKAPAAAPGLTVTESPPNAPLSSQSTQPLVEGVVAVPAADQEVAATREVQAELTPVSADRPLAPVFAAGVRDAPDLALSVDNLPELPELPELPAGDPFATALAAGALDAPDLALSVDDLPELPELPEVPALPVEQSLAPVQDAAALDALELALSVDDLPELPALPAEEPLALPLAAGVLDAPELALSMDDLPELPALPAEEPFATALAAGVLDAPELALSVEDLPELPALPAEEPFATALAAGVLDAPELALSVEDLPELPASPAEKPLAPARAADADLAPVEDTVANAALGLPAAPDPAPPPHAPGLVAVDALDESLGVSDAELAFDDRLESVEMPLGTGASAGLDGTHTPLDVPEWSFAQQVDAGVVEVDESTQDAWAAAFAAAAEPAAAADAAMLAPGLGEVPSSADVAESVLLEAEALPEPVVTFALDEPILTERADAPVLAPEVGAEMPLGTGAVAGIDGTRASLDVPEWSFVQQVDAGVVEVDELPQDAWAAAFAPATGSAAAVDLMPDLAAPQQPDPDLDAYPDDPELVSMFMEEARELLDGLDTKFRAWQLAPQELGILDSINRLLHTLKGGARLTGLHAIGDLSHALETRLTAIAAAPGQVDDTALELAQQAVDRLSLQFDALEKQAPIPPSTALAEALTAVPTPAAVAVDAPDLAVLHHAAEPEPEPEPGSSAADSHGAARRAVGAVAAVSQIRVPSDLLNRLVDNAGEIGLYRARLTQRNSMLGFSLGELDQTVTRLREQLRQLEIETETQILFRFEREEASEAEGPVFDPLEMDRFSTLQQLSRSLAETVNDLVSLRDVLGGYQRESTDLLTQQARLADDLQDGLLRTRMVPFVQVVPRLHRLVRQTADSLGKSARLEVIGPEVELDRAILDRLAAPLEHLLRNAVDHGLESAALRTAAGKPAIGQVTLELSREGNDVVIKLADDGAGLDLAAIRSQAVARGLLDPQVTLADAALMQFVFEPGFTTHGQVTQISGRGVGLDVVASEIKAANGTIDLASSPGRGTSFSIRLPLTLAILKALLVGVGTNVYAVPYAAVEAVARISREDLTAIYQDDGRDFDYRGETYRVASVAGLLDPGVPPNLGESRWLPLLLVRVGDLRVALQVDTLIESARVLVKPLGAKLAALRWLAGGTILADGRVALILDILALLRSGAIHAQRSARAAVTADVGSGPESELCVMVVDDSLTVRRVTTRMLRSQNIEVITAKDGVEALTMLDDRVPDLMLLDIEMPRMDGYELTRLIRRSERLHDLPIIMITSRTGEKHRDHALGLGVNRFLGKPYRESELLDEIGSLLAEQRS